MLGRFALVLASLFSLNATLYMNAATNLTQLLMHADVTHAHKLMLPDHPHVHLSHVPLQTRLAALLVCGSVLWLLASHSPDIKDIKEDVMQAHDSIFEYLVSWDSRQSIRRIDLWDFTQRSLRALSPCFANSRCLILLLLATGQVLRWRQEHRGIDRGQ